MATKTIKPLIELEPGMWVDPADISSIETVRHELGFGRSVVVTTKARRALEVSFTGNDCTARASDLIARINVLRGA